MTRLFVSVIGSWCYAFVAGVILIYGLNHWSLPGTNTLSECALTLLMGLGLVILLVTALLSFFWGFVRILEES